MLGRKLNNVELCELDAREFLTDEVWKRWKLRYDECMGFRKTLKGKPTDEQRMQLQANADDLVFYNRVLWHSDRMSRMGRCVCTTCGQKRDIKATV